MLTKTAVITYVQGDTTVRIAESLEELVCAPSCVCVYRWLLEKPQFSSRQMWDSWVKFDRALHMQGVCSTTQLYLPYLYYPF